MSLQVFLTQIRNASNKEHIAQIVSRIELAIQHGGAGKTHNAGVTACISEQGSENDYLTPVVSYLVENNKLEEALALSLVSKEYMKAFKTQYPDAYKEMNAKKKLWKILTRMQTKEHVPLYESVEIKVVSTSSRAKKRALQSLPVEQRSVFDENEVFAKNSQFISLLDADDLVPAKPVAEDEYIGRRSLTLSGMHKMLKHPELQELTICQHECDGKVKFQFFFVRGANGEVKKIDVIVKSDDYENGSKDVRKHPGRLWNETINLVALKKAMMIIANTNRVI